VFVDAPPPAAALVALAPRSITPPPVAPLETGPRVVLLPPLLGDGSARIRWRAPRSAGTFEVAARHPGGAWRTLVARLLRKSYVVRGAAGSRIAVRVRARSFSNVAGGWSAPQQITFRSSR
jgi:hypothetical protein